MKKIKISIIEDSEIHKEWLRAELTSEQDIELISIDTLGKKGIESIKTNKPDLLILDFQLEDMTGLEVAKRVKSYDPNIKVFVLTAHTEITIIERIINEKHIDAIAIKGSPYLDDFLIPAIKQIIAGGTYIEPSILGKLRETRDLKGLSELSKREFEIFIQSSMGKTDERIAKDLCVELPHIKNFKSKIAKKIKNHDLTGLLSKLIENSPIQ